MNIGRKRRFLPEELSSIDAITRAVKRLHTSSPSVSSLAESTQAQSSGSMHAQSGLQETSMTQEADSMGALALEVDQPAVETQSRPPRHRNDSPLPPSPCGSLSRHLASRAARWRSQNRLRRSIGSMCLPEREPSYASSMSPSPSGASEGVGGILQDSCASPGWHPSEAHTAGLDSPSCQATAAGILQDGPPTHFKAPAPRGPGACTTGYPPTGPTHPPTFSMGSPPPKGGWFTATGDESRTPPRHPLGASMGRSPSMMAEQGAEWGQEGTGSVGVDEWPLASGQVDSELPAGPRHEVDMAQVAIARLVGRQQMGDEDAAASARLELLNALDDLDMGPQPAASSTPSRLPRRLNLPRNSSVTFIPNPLTQFPSGPASPFSPLAPSSSGGQPPRPLTHSMSGLAAADIKRPSSGHYPLPHSALDRLPGLPERRQSLRRCSSLREQIRPIPADSIAESDPAGSAARETSRNVAGRLSHNAAHSDEHPRMDSVPSAAGGLSSVPQHEGAEEPELMTAARQKGFGEDCSAGSSRFFRASGTDPGRSKGDAARVVDQSGGPQMPGTPDRICSEDGSPAQPQAEGGVEGSGRAYDTVYEEANHLLRNLHFERIRRTKRSWQWDL
ncbi:hypothetical protein WJX74_004959 [Apatococcus lobatus]|uniref:Uncharacterized protein n=1 Tax=Apatococcus lobatus TaxID=904363 RepID=A0AAW1RUH9_9CHLO